MDSVPQKRLGLPDSSQPPITPARASGKQQVDLVALVYSWTMSANKLIIIANSVGEGERREVKTLAAFVKKSLKLLAPTTEVYTNELENDLRTILLALKSAVHAFTPLLALFNEMLDEVPIQH